MKTKNMFGLAIVAIVVNLIFYLGLLAGAVWVVVKVLQLTGVL